MASSAIKQAPAILAGLLIWFLAGCAGTADVPPQRLPVKLGAKSFKLELALDSATRYQGLSDRKSIADDGGMLFVFAEADNLDFVMRHCYVPIDLIYLGPDGKVVSFHQMAVVAYDTPAEDLVDYSSGWKAQFAIEIKGGTLNQLGLKLGQQINLPLENLKRWAK